jgi:hypothetical protein
VQVNFGKLKDYQAMHIDISELIAVCEAIAKAQGVL